MRHTTSVKYLNKQDKCQPAVSSICTTCTTLEIILMPWGLPRFVLMPIKQWVNVNQYIYLRTATTDTTSQKRRDSCRWITIAKWWKRPRCRRRPPPRRPPTPPGNAALLTTNALKQSDSAKVRFTSHFDQRKFSESNHCQLEFLTLQLTYKVVRNE